MMRHNLACGTSVDSCYCSPKAPSRRFCVWLELRMQCVNIQRKSDYIYSPKTATEGKRKRGCEIGPLHRYGCGVCWFFDFYSTAKQKWNRFSLFNCEFLCWNLCLLTGPIKWPFTATTNGYRALQIDSSRHVFGTRFPITTDSADSFSGTQTFRILIIRSQFLLGAFIPNTKTVDQSYPGPHTFGTTIACGLTKGNEDRKKCGR